MGDVILECIDLVENYDNIMMAYEKLNNDNLFPKLKKLENNPNYFKVYFDDCSALANLTVLNGPLTTKLRKDREVVMKFISETPDVTKANKKVIKKFNKQLKEFTQTVEKTMSNCVRMIQICDRILA